jgi:hypothetical protein
MLINMFKISMMIVFVFIFRTKLTSIAIGAFFTFSLTKMWFFVFFNFF